ncbi:MAG: GAF domain-containing protein [Flavobacteriales bacterium]|nr:GAF domain-containing protein [Flavobacteriales bacterium]
MINSFSNMLLKAKTIDEILWTITNHAIAKLNYEDCVVYFRVGNELIQKAAYGFKNPEGFDIINPIVLKIGEGICGAVLATGKSEIIADTSVDPRYIIDNIPRFSEITVPIILGNEVVGVIDSEHSKKNFFKKKDLEVLETIASIVSVKISQIQSHDQLSIHKNELRSYAMRMVSKSEMVFSLKKTLDSLKNKIDNNKNSSKDIAKLKSQLNDDIRLDKDWETLQLHIQETTKDFYRKLQEKHELLTQYDLKLCTFIYLGLDTKQIAQILSVDPHSLTTQRYRMRKKMKLETKESLFDYINKIVIGVYE